MYRMSPQKALSFVGQVVIAKERLVLFSPSAIFQKSKIFTTLSTKNEKHFYELLDYLPN